MRLTFWGAARQVTGSMHLLELENDFKLLIDCGQDLERERKLAEDGTYQAIFPFEPSQINAVVLTHAHIDHSGFLPNLVREGFEGEIYCTHATYDLANLLLHDAASLNQRKIKKIDKSKRYNPAHKEQRLLKRELYLAPHVNQTLGHFKLLSFKQRKKIGDGLYITLIPTGHLLGAANVVVEAEENGKTTRIGFSGDLGRYDYPLLSDPEPTPEVDYLVCESTYGNRHHSANGNPEEIVLDVIQRACVDKPGRLLVPAFSVGRTQALLYILNKLCVEERLPAIKIYTDSPLAKASTQVYQKHLSLLNQEAKDFYKENESLFDFENLIYLDSSKASKAIANYNHPYMVVSSSGMIQGGRIEYHIKQNIQNAMATVLLIGYSAEGTLGHDLLNGRKYIVADKHELAVNATIENTDIFSGHGDLEDLIKFVKWQSPDKVKKVFLVHGEHQSMIDFKETLGNEGYAQVEIPEKGQSFEL
ncbi:MBL fold hydrolase [marine bacterium AO1-C]|nr:MBL fold hydrolase [marine bacterium AO1-C]